MISRVHLGGPDVFTLALAESPAKGGRVGQRVGDVKGQVEGRGSDDVGLLVHDGVEGGLGEVVEVVEGLPGRSLSKR